MNEKDRIKIVSGIDILVGIFLLITGILVVIMGVDSINMMSEASAYSSPPLYYTVLPWILLMLGFCAIIYGIILIILEGGTTGLIFIMKAKEHMMIIKGKTKMIQIQMEMA